MFPYTIYRTASDWDGKPCYYNLFSATLQIGFANANFEPENGHLRAYRVLPLSVLFT
jgi:hypothetical protein